AGASRCASQLSGARFGKAGRGVLSEGLYLGGTRIDHDRAQRTVAAVGHRRRRFFQGTLLKARPVAMTSVTREAWEQVMALSSGINLPLGPNSTDRYLFDPKRLAFFLARYKFASKMLKRCKNIVDVGCGDGMGTLIYVSDTGAERVRGIDFDAKLVDH